MNLLDRMDACAYCGGPTDLDSGLLVPGLLDEAHPLARSVYDPEGEVNAVVLACRSCAERLDLDEPDAYRTLRANLREVLSMDEHDDHEHDEPETVAAEQVSAEDSSPAPLPADAPPGETYGARQAAQVLGVSARRVSQLAQDGRLVIVQDRPLRVSAQSVHELRAERRASPAGGRAQATPPESVAEQVERLVSLVTAESRKAIEAQEHLLGEVSSQRDELRTEVERLRAEVERERARADELAERLTVPQVVEEPRRRSWWRK